MIREHYIKRFSVFPEYWNLLLNHGDIKSIFMFTEQLTDLFIEISLTGSYIYDPQNLIPYMYYFLSMHNHDEKIIIRSIQSVIYHIGGVHIRFNIIPLNITYALFPDEYFDELFENSTFPNGELICNHKKEILDIKHMFEKELKKYMQNVPELSFIKELPSFDKNFIANLKQKEANYDIIMEDDIKKKIDAIKKQTRDNEIYKISKSIQNRLVGVV